MNMDQSVVSLCELRGAAEAPAIAFEVGKGHLSVNPYHGCNIGCPFCISQADPWRAAGGSGRVVLASVLEILAALERDAEIVSQLKLSLMDFCDPFEPALEPTLRHLLAGIGERLPGQAVVLTTRLGPSRGLLRWMAGLDSLRLSLFVSMGDACGGVRPVTPVAPRLALLEQGGAQGLHTVMLLRPLVREWTRADVLRRLLVHARRTCHEVVLAGLSLPPVVEASLRSAGWPVPAAPADAHGGVEPDLLREVLSLADEVLGHDTPLSEHRSCAVNRHRGLACKVAHHEHAERGDEEPSRLESSEWRALVGDAPLRVRACSCLAGPRAQVTTRACIGFCAAADAPTPPVKACIPCLSGSGRPRDRAGYCLLRAA